MQIKDLRPIFTTLTGWFFLISADFPADAITAAPLSADANPAVAPVRPSALRPPKTEIKISPVWPTLIDDNSMRRHEQISIAMVGDIMTGTTYPTERLPKNGGRDLFSAVKTILRSADLTVGNLEGAICEGGTCTKKVAAGRSYAFKMPPAHAPLLSDAGFDFLSLANNHSNDFGPEGRLETIELLEQERIAYAGLPGCESAVIERDGVRFGLCAFGHNAHTLKHRDTVTVKRILDSLSERSDIVIVSFHGGAEGAKHAHLPEGPETYLGEDRGDLRAFAHFCIRHGADIVYGHGPHVTRAIELFQGRFIAYSLGNFCTPFGVNLDGINGHAPVIEIAIDRSGEFVKGKIHSFIQQYEVGPRPDLRNETARQIRALTASDIVDPSLIISDDGNLSLRE